MPKTRAIRRKNIIPKSTNKSAVPSLKRTEENIQKCFVTLNQLRNGTSQSLKTLKVIKSDRKILKASISIFMKVTLETGANYFVVCLIITNNNQKTTIAKFQCEH